ncbi:hypothetical protein JCGZ_12393 [Jatropha curcas]|uniref:Glutamate receptor n=1 Tax=Jatropha curcas TaxID=180498 RepID=A0A067K744_JATCU|nr:glutamate receptor 2.9 [Jatropha curcas]KDP31932.1 hypothetical protein JCGZ_12393 [Jatropha curcas]
MEIAVQDFYSLTGHNLSLHIVDLSGNSAKAVFAAIELVKDQKVQAIAGALTWQEAAIVAEMDEINKEVPVISLTQPSSPIVPNKKFPVIGMYQDISMDISCISAIVASFKWTKVNAIYEGRNSYTSNLGGITLLSSSLREIGVELEYFSAFPEFSSLVNPNIIIQKELQTLREKQSKVFIFVQTSLTLTTMLFENAKQMGMMGEGYVWIMADGIANLIDSVNASAITSMQGVLGFRTHYSDNTASFREFQMNFQRVSIDEYPKEDKNHHPSVYALRAYDSIWTIAKAAKILQQKNDSKPLLQHILSSDFEGLSSRIQFQNYKLGDKPTFQILNIVGKSYREIGFWSEELGFTKNLVKHANGKNKNLTAEEGLDRVYWPGGRTSVPTGFLETKAKELRIAVLARSTCSQFLKANHDDKQNITYITGFSIDVFEAAVRRLQYPLMYNLFPFYGSYNDLIKEVSNKTFDAAIGDILITADRNQHIEFSQPYIQAGLVMVVTMKSDESLQFWMFMKPFTKGMWILMAAMTLFTGFVIWCLEHRINSDFRGPPNRQIGTLLWFSFSTLVFAHRESIRSQWSRLVLAPWLFLILIVTSTYTANLTSLLTNPQLEPSGTDIGSLKRTRATIGCNGNPFTFWYLEKVLGFKTGNIKTIASIDDFAKALSSGDIRAAFMFTPHARVFLSEFSTGFTMTGPTYKLTGFGFVFPKGSSLALNISEAIIYLTQSGELQQLEEQKLSYSKYSTSPSTASSGTQGLGPRPLAGLFIISGSVSIFALIVVAISLLRSHWESSLTFIQTMLAGRAFWSWLTTFFAKNDLLQL